MDATDEMAEFRAVTSVESAFEMAMSFAMSEPAVFVKLNATELRAELRATISVEIAFEIV